MDNQTGEVTIISAKNNAVCIDGTWYNLGPKVKLTYVKKGKCEYEIEQTGPDENDLVVFIKSTNGNEYSKPKPDAVAKHPDIINSEMNRMSALKFAGNIYQGTAQEEDAKRLAEEAHEYLQKGMWVTTEKV